MLTDSDPVCTECKKPATWYVRELKEILHSKVWVTVFYCDAHHPEHAKLMPRNTDD